MSNVNITFSYQGEEVYSIEVPRNTKIIEFKSGPEYNAYTNVPLRTLEITRIEMWPPSVVDAR